LNRHPKQNSVKPPQPSTQVHNPSSFASLTHARRFRHTILFCGLEQSGVDLGNRSQRRTA
jgi:hypothetical protein